MSVVDIEIPEKELPKTVPNGTWMCLECHKELSTSMNIGLAEKGICKRCGASKHDIYMVDNGQIM